MNPFNLRGDYRGSSGEHGAVGSDETGSLAIDVDAHAFLVFCLERKPI